MSSIESIKTQLDEDSAAATEAARDGHPGWQKHWPNPGLYSGTRDILDGDLTVIARVGAPVAEHIARHDPARVLADVEAKRAILAEYERDPQADDQYRAGLAFALERLADAYRP